MQAPAAQSAPVVVNVELALKPFKNVADIGEAVLLKCLSGFG